MIKLIVGLGNPGQQYEKTRHNAGFLFLDELAAERSAIWSCKPEFQGLLSNATVAGEKILLLKPQTFMNKSGQAVGKLVRYYKFAPEEILVVHDELDFCTGVIRLKHNGGHAGHNGLKDIIANLGSANFFRLRLGIGRPADASSVANYVLSAPAKSEWLELTAAIALGVGCIDRIIAGDFQAVMNKLNS